MLKIVLCGTPNFTINFFEEFLKNKDKYLIIGVITRTPKEIKKKLYHSDVAKWAIKNNLPLYEVDKINSSNEIRLLLSDCDLVLVFAYGKIISQLLLDLPKFGWFNIHPSLLPRFRGAAPVQYALLNNIEESALTLMKMNAKMDEGDIIAQKRFFLNPFHNLYTVFFELGCWGPKWVEENLAFYLKNLISYKQDHSQSSYSFLIKKEDYYVEQDCNDLILRKIKAFGYVFFYYDEVVIKCFVAKKYEEGDLLNINGIAPIFLQISGKKIMHIRVFLNGFRKKII